MGIDQIVKIGKPHPEVEVSRDRTIEEGCNMLVPMGIILKEELLGKCKL